MLSASVSVGRNSNLLQMSVIWTQLLLAASLALSSASWAQISISGSSLVNSIWAMFCKLPLLYRIPLFSLINVDYEIYKLEEQGRKLAELLKAAKAISKSLFKKN
jgi:hypothetical protein